MMVTVVLTKQSGLVQGAGLLQADLVAAFQSDAPVLIDTAQLGGADLSFLQTIEAARRHASVNESDVVLSEPASAELRDVLDRAGLSATFTPADRSFWLHEG